MEPLVSESQHWQQTADQLLEQAGLLPLLGQHGEVYITGSYRYGLLMSADIDLYLLSPHAGKAQALSILLTLIEQGFWNVYMLGDWVQFRWPSLPPGYYLGLKRDFAGARWKVDIWNLPAIPPATQEYNAWLARSLTPAARELILAIKKACGQQKWDVSGVTIYDAVLTRKVQSVEQFLEQLGDEPALPDSAPVSQALGTQPNLFDPSGIA